MEPVADFDFYIKFTKPLVLNLPQVKERALAAAWVKKLVEDSSAPHELKLDYIKLLLFLLQRRHLVAPFTQHPNEVEALTEFDEGHDLVSVARRILESERNQKSADKATKKAYPPYISDFSADLLEYCAVQEIENFGVHGYYALSHLPLMQWAHVDKQVLPKAAKSLLEVSPQPEVITGTLSAVDIAPPDAKKVSIEEPDEAEPAPPPPEEEAPPADDTPTPKRKKPMSPVRPLGKVSPDRDQREPPSWGSTLLEVKGVVGETIPEELETLWTSGTPPQSPPASAIPRPPSPKTPRRPRSPRPTPSPRTPPPRPPLRTPPRFVPTPPRSVRPPSPSIELEAATPTVAEQAYDLEEAAKYGLTAADLKDISVGDDDDDMNVSMPLSDVSINLTPELDEAEEAYLRQQDEELKRLEAEIAEAEQQIESPTATSLTVSPVGPIELEAVPLPPVPPKSPEAAGGGLTMTTKTTALKKPASKTGLRPPQAGASGLKKPSATSLRPPEPVAGPSGLQRPVAGPSGLQRPATGLRPPGTGLKPPGTGLKPPGTGLKPPGTGLKPPGGGLKKPGAPGLKPPGVASKKSLTKRPSGGLKPPKKAPAAAAPPPPEPEQVLQTYGLQSTTSEAELEILNERNRILSEMEAEFLQEEAQAETEAAEEAAAAGQEYEPPTVRRKKSQKSRLRKPGARGRSHDTPVALEEAIHISPEGRDIIQQAQNLSAKKKKPKTPEQEAEPVAGPSTAESGYERLMRIMEQQTALLNAEELQAAPSPKKDKEAMADFNQMAEIMEGLSPEQADESSFDQFAEDAAMLRLSNVYEEMLPPDRRTDVPLTPPVFSRHRRVREAAQGLRYRPDETGVSRRQRWTPAEQYFEETPMRWSPKHDPRQTSHVMETFPGMELDEMDQSFDTSMPDDYVELAMSPVQDNVKTRGILEDVDLLERSGLGLYDVPCTMPSPSTSPRRPLNTGDILKETPPKTPAARKPRPVDPFEGEEADRTLMHADQFLSPPEPYRPIFHQVVEDYNQGPAERYEGLDSMHQGAVVDPMYEFEYVTPEKLKQFEELDETRTPEGAAAISPEGSSYMDYRFDNIKSNLFGDPEMSDIFEEMPPIEGELEEEHLHFRPSAAAVANVQRSPLPPEIDREAFMQELEEHEMDQYREPYRQRLPSGQVIQRYSGAPQVETIPEYGEDLSPRRRRFSERVRGHQPRPYVKDRGRVTTLSGQLLDITKRQPSLPPIAEPGNFRDSPKRRGALFKHPQLAVKMINRRAVRPRNINFDESETIPVPPGLVKVRKELRKQVESYSEPGDQEEFERQIEELNVSADDLALADIVPSEASARTPESPPESDVAMWRLKVDLGSYQGHSKKYLRKYPIREVPQSPKAARRAEPPSRGVTNVRERFGRRAQALQHVPEQVVEERAAILSDQMEAEAEAEVRRKWNILDEPLSPDGGHRSPLRPHRPTDFTTPEHLRPHALLPLGQVPSEKYERRATPPSPIFARSPPRAHPPSPKFAERTPPQRGFDDLMAEADELDDSAPSLRGSPVAMTAEAVAAKAARQYRQLMGEVDEEEEAEEFRRLEKIAAGGSDAYDEMPELLDDSDHLDHVIAGAEQSFYQKSPVQIDYVETVDDYGTETYAEGADGFDLEALEKLGFSKSDIEQIQMGEETLGTSPKSVGQVAEFEKSIEQVATPPARRPPSPEPFRTPPGLERPEYATPMATTDPYSRPQLPFTTPARSPMIRVPTPPPAADLSGEEADYADYDYHDVSLVDLDEFSEEEEEAMTSVREDARSVLRRYAELKNASPTRSPRSPPHLAFSPPAYRTPSPPPARRLPSPPSPKTPVMSPRRMVRPGSRMASPLLTPPEAQAGWSPGLRMPLPPPAFRTPVASVSPKTPEGKKMIHVGMARSPQARYDDSPIPDEEYSDEEMDFKWID